MFDVVTHSRFFNLDEVCAIALLDLFMLKGNYNLIRTRDSSILKSHQENMNSYVIDVGFEYDEGRLNFDHHQKSMKFTWNDGTPFSSCGLIWKHLKNKGLIKLSDKEIEIFESNFVKAVDLQDNGIKYFNEMNFVNLSNRNHSDNNFIDRQFVRSLNQVKIFINQLIDNIKSNKDNIFCKNVPISLFIDKLTSCALITNFAFENNFKTNIDDVKNTVHWNFINRKGNDDYFLIDFSNNKFSHGNSDYNVSGFMTIFVWEYLKKNNFLNSKMNDETVFMLHSKIIDCFIRNKAFNEVSYIAMYENSDESSQLAHDAMHGYIVNAFVEVRTEIQADKSIKKFIKSSNNLEGIVFLTQNIKSAPSRIAKICDDKKLVIIPRDKSSWKVQAIPNRKNAFSKVISMPKEWCGLKGTQLHKVSGINNLIFCHKEGFMCMFEGNKEDVISFAKNVIKLN